jgi:DNA-binding transcriptional LysR family regulator
MTYDQLEVLDMIVKKGSFRAAAEALRRTQPTLSIAIKKLEEEFDLLLFNRESYRPVLTAEGQAFHTWANRALRAFHELSMLGEQLGKQKIEPQLTIVIDPLARFASLKGIFSECLNHFRPTVLTLRSEVLEGGLDLLLQGDADFAIASELSAHPDIESHAFDRIELVPCLAPSLVTDALQAPIRLDDLTQIVVRTRESRTHKVQTSMGVREDGRRCYVTDHGMKRSLIQDGFGWGRLARHEIYDDLASNRLLVMEEALAPSLWISLRLMRNRKRPLGPVGKAIWASLMQTATLGSPDPGA